MLSSLIKREMTTTLRTQRTRVMAFLYLLALAGVVIWMWPDQALFSVAAQSTRSMILVFVLTLVALVILYAPAVSATSIVSEKENNSYDLLFASRLRPWEIVAGKLFAALLVLLIFVIFSFPVFVSGFFLGAVSIQETIRIYAICAVTSLFSGLIGLAISARSSSSYAALLRTYSFVLLLGIGPWIPYILLSSNSFWIPVVHSFRALSPLSAVSSLLIPGFDPQSTITEIRPAWVLYIWYACAGSVILFGIVLIDAYRMSGPPVRRSAKVIDNPAELSRRRKRFPFYLIDPDRRKRLLADWMNPVYARELRSKAFGGGIWIFRGAYLCLCVSIILMVLMLGNFTQFTPATIKATAIGFQIGLVMLLIPPLTAGGITRERELRMIDDLRLSRIGAWQLLSGKLLVAFVFVLFLAVGSVPLWIVIVYMQMNTPQELLTVGAILLSTVLLGLTSGLVSSSFLRRTSAAAAAAYGLLCVVVLSTLLPYLQPEKFADVIRNRLLSLNPFVSAVQVVNSDQFSQTQMLWRDHLLFSLILSGLFFILTYINVRRLLRPEN